MKSPGVSRRPFVGIALVAAVAIIAAEFLRVPGEAVPFVFIAVIFLGLVLLWQRNHFLIYLFIWSSFVLLHNLRTSATPGLSLAAKLGDRSRDVTITGAV